jgi:hypothetical protein
LILSFLAFPVISMLNGEYVFLFESIAFGVDGRETRLREEDAEFPACLANGYIEAKKGRADNP